MGRSLHNKIHLGRRFPLFNVEKFTVVASSIVFIGVLFAVIEVMS